MRLSQLEFSHDKFFMTFYFAKTAKIVRLLIYSVSVLHYAFASGHECKIRFGTRYVIDIDPQTKVRTILCVPQKVGSFYWASLVLLRHLGHPPPDFNTWGLANELHLTVKSFHANDRVLTISRNPFHRTLSEYLNHIHNNNIRVEYLRAFHVDRNVSFPSYVERLSHIDVCVSRHSCYQSSECLDPCLTDPPRIFHIEEQHMWFKELLNIMNITESQLEGDEWLPSTNKTYFYRASEQPFDSTHATHASERSNILNYYDNNTASLVSKIYAADFKAFNYESELAMRR